MIIDDDKPGNIVFDYKKNHVRHVVTDSKCIINVLRQGGADGIIQCDYKTVTLDKKYNESAAEPDIDYINSVGTL